MFRPPQLMSAAFMGGSKICGFLLPVGQVAICCTHFGRYWHRASFSRCPANCRIRG